MQGRIKALINYFFPSTNSKPNIPLEIIVPDIPLEIIFHSIVSQLKEIEDVARIFQVNKKMYQELRVTQTPKIMIYTKKEKLEEVAKRIGSCLEEERAKYRLPDHLIWHPVRRIDFTDRDITLSGTLFERTVTERALEENIEEVEGDVEAERMGTYADLICAFKNSHGYTHTQTAIERITEKNNKICPLPETLAGKVSLALFTVASVAATATSIGGAIVLGPQCWWVNHFRNVTREEIFFNESISEYQSRNITYQLNEPSLACPDSAKAIFIPMFSVGYPLAGLSLAASIAMCCYAKPDYLRIDKRQNIKEQILRNSRLFLFHSCYLDPEKLSKDIYIADIERVKISSPT